ncbi:uncharacterized protein LOC133105543 isoform X2 [Conger conger]|uniref:uncharacterized protein LOC133105543 isoform X2 n=1 Tax=Conger conger TaxID=82655 RepID=UPI002A5ADBB6|nr:uncharacterized protein LOC133105543 isoform X2 [Conger conger]
MDRNVILMSTLHRDATVSTDGHRKPHIILDYNRNKGGVDCLDKLTGTYTCKLKSARWPVAVFHNILDVSAYNAYVVWTAPSLESGETLQEETLPGRAWESFGYSSDTTAPAPSPHTSLCQSGEECAGPSHSSVTSHSPSTGTEKEEVHALCPQQWRLVTSRIEEAIFFRLLTSLAMECSLFSYLSLCWPKAYYLECKLQSESSG